MLDKNCYLHAKERVNQFNQLDFETYSLFGNIARHCDTIIFNTEIEEFVYRRLKKSQDNNFLKLWDELCGTEAKTNRWYKLVPMNVDLEIKEEDRFLVGLARSANATLVTADIKLIKILKPNNENYSVKFKVKVLTPEQANLEISKNTVDESKIA